MRDPQELEELLKKAPNQTSISTKGSMLPVVVEALNTFEDADTIAEALKRALKNWLFSRQQDSKRGALREIKQDTAAILERLDRLELHLSRIQGGSHADSGSDRELQSTADALAEIVDVLRSRLAGQALVAPAQTQAPIEPGSGNG